MDVAFGRTDLVEVDEVKMWKGVSYKLRELKGRRESWSRAAFHLDKVDETSGYVI